MSLLDKLTSLVKGGSSQEEIMADLLKSLPYEDSPVAKPNAAVIPPAGVANVNMMEGLSDTHSEPRKGLDYEQLDAMAQVHIVSAIIQTRVNQIAEFAVPQREGADIGFQIRLKDEAIVMDDEMRQKMEDLYEFLISCGDKRLASDVGFEGFLRMLTRDSLTYDTACFEIVRNRKGDVSGFQNVDSSTIRRAKLSEKERSAGRRDPDAIHYVQVIEDKVVSEFKARELCFGIRRPRSKLGLRGYGNPELAECVTLITNLLNAEVFNASNFSNGINANALIAVKTRMSPQLFRQFRREFYNFLNGSANAKKTPLIALEPDAGEGIEAITLDKNNRDMEFSEWHRYQIKMICALFQVDPMELGLKMGSEGVSSSMQEESGLSRVAMSKDKGLRPLLRAIQTWLNDYVVNEIDDRFELVFTGLDQISVKEQLEIDHKKITTFMTVNEMRASYGLPLIQGGDIILNDTYLKGMELSIGAEVSEDSGPNTPDEFKETSDYVEPSMKPEPVKPTSAKPEEQTLADEEAAEQGGRDEGN